MSLWNNRKWSEAILHSDNLPSWCWRVHDWMGHWDRKKQDFILLVHAIISFIIHVCMSACPEFTHCNFYDITFAGSCCWRRWIGITVLLPLSKDILTIIWEKMGEERHTLKRRALIHMQWRGKYYRWTQTMNNGEDWWNTDNSTTADLFRHPMDDVRNSRHSLDVTYCRLSRFYPCSHSCLMFASNGSMKVTQSSCLSKNTGKMTLPVNQGQSWWWRGGRIHLKKDS